MMLPNLREASKAFTLVAFKSFEFGNILISKLQGLKNMKIETLPDNFNSFALNVNFHRPSFSRRLVFKQLMIQPREEPECDSKPAKSNEEKRFEERRAKPHFFYLFLQTVLHLLNYRNCTKNI